MEFFHEKVKAALKKQNMSQCELARLLNIKQASVWEWLNNKGYPNLTRFYQLCCVLKVTPNYLLGIEEGSEELKQA